MKIEKKGFYEAVEMLKTLDGPHQKRLLEQLAAQDPELAEKLKNRLFQFEDLANVGKNALLSILKNVNERTLFFALRGASSEVKNAVFSCFSPRAAQMLQENIDALGPQPLSKVKEAQTEIAHIALSLEILGKVVLRTDSDDPLV